MYVRVFLYVAKCSSALTARSSALAVFHRRVRVPFPQDPVHLLAVIARDDSPEPSTSCTFILSSIRPLTPRSRLD